MTNEELQNCIAMLATGDKIAFENIYKELSTPMYTIILRIVRDKSLSEDILQEVFVKLYQSPPTSAKSPRAYLFQMARNLAIDGVRKKQQFTDLEHCEKLVYLPLDDLSQKVDIDNALKALPLIECQIVSLRVNGGLRFREIADILKIPLGTVIWKYHRSIERLRSHFYGGAL